jgi:acetylornithine/succinyldiaminopimelate/putrescine aminotransferase
MSETEAPAQPVAAPPQPYADYGAAADAFARHVNPGKVAFLREAGVELVMGAREGARFQDAYSGRWYLNCHCNGGVFNLGHRNPQVVEALRGALDTLDVGNHHLVSGYRASAAEQLAASTDGALPGIVWAVGGGEAIDLALKLARGHTGRQRIVSAQGGYHGHTGLALATGDAQYREPFGHRLPGFEQVPFNDLAALEAALRGGEVAAVILEAIPATLGFPMPAPGYFAAVRGLCDEHGALLIVDEVQTGLGRTGRVWSYQHEGMTPDMLVTGKGLGGGVYPIAATLVTPALLEFFARNPFAHVSTFGGAELGCVAASTVLGIVSEPAFLERVRVLGERFEAAFAPLDGFELRRRGLTMGLAFPGEGGAIGVWRALLDAGVFTLFAGNDTSVLQFKPPLTASDEEAAEIIALVSGVLA